MHFKESGPNGRHKADILICLSMICSLNVTFAGYIIKKGIESKERFLVQENGITLAWQQKKV